MGCLLDVQFDITGDRPAEWPGDGLRQAVERRGQFVRQDCAVGRPAVQQGVGHGTVDEGLGAHAAGSKAASFLVRPDDEFKGGFGLSARILKAFQHLQCGKRAERTVEAPAGRLRVEMAADQEGGKPITAAGSPHEEVRGRILKDRKAAGSGDLGDCRAGLPVALGQRLPVDPAVGRAADGGEGVEPAEQPCSVDRGPDGHCMSRACAAVAPFYSMFLRNIQET